MPYDPTPRMKPAYEKQLTEEVDNWHEAFELLGIIDAEFRSDPMSVQCFDLRVVERVRNCVAKYAELKKQNPYL